MQFPHGETATIQQAGTTTDRYGNTVVDWTAPTETAVAGCAFAPRSSDEDRGDYRAAVIVGLSMFAPPGTTITASDRVKRADGSVWEIEGQPARWRNPFTGTDFGVEVALRKVDG